MNPTPLHYDPFSGSALTDPMPLYRELRSHSPVHRLEAYDGWALSRFQDVWDTFLDREHFSEAEGQVFAKEVVSVSNRGVAPKPASTDPLTMFNLLDPPLHTQLRRVMAGPLHPGSIAQLEPFIRSVTRRTLDRLCARVSFDANLDFASFISCHAVCHVIGLPVDDDEVPAIVALVNRVSAREPGRSGMTPDAWAAVAELGGRVAGAVSRRRSGEIASACPFVDCLMASSVLGRPMADGEIIAQVMSLLIGGVESLPKIMAGGLVELWRHPDQRDAIAADPARIPAAIEEMIRFHAPAQWFGRTLNCDFEIAGTKMRAGERVFLLTASANRDEREFEDPDVFRSDRRMRRVVAFGVGPHFCAGVFLARLEARIMIEEFLARVRHYEINLDRAQRSVSEFQIGWTHLPLEIRALA